VALIVCIAAPLMLLFTIPVLKELAWLLIVGFLLAGVYAGTMRSRARQLPFPRERDRLFGDVLKLLKRDMDPSVALEVQLCLGSLEQTGKAVQQRLDPYNPDQRLEDWRNPWFAVKGRFLDGNLFSLRLVECITRSVAEDKSPKARHKARQPDARNSGFDLSLQLHVEQEHYGSLTLLQPHVSSAVKLLPGAELLRHHSEGQDLSLVLSLPPAFTASLMYQSITALFLSAYHVLHLSARLPQLIGEVAPEEGLHRNGLGHHSPSREQIAPLHYPGELGS
jgi:hypothetical protein